MFRETSTLVLLLSALPLALCQSTTLQAFFAPPRAGASVITVAPTATTYSVQCTSACSGAENIQATLVNGPSTAGFTQIWFLTDNSQRTLIYDCAISSSSIGSCITKAISAGETGTLTAAPTFKPGPLVVTAGLEQLGISLATTTTEVNTTVTVKKTTKAPTPSPTLLSNTTSSGYSNSTASTTRTSSSTSVNLPATAAPSSTSSGAAAATMKAERVGGAIIGLAGLLLAAL